MNAVEGIAWLDGAWMPLAEARVSVCDRGYLFGDGVYEVVRTYRRRPWALDLHLERFQRSMEAIALRGVDPERARALVLEGNRRAGYENARIYFHATRGVAPRAHPYPGDSRPTLLVTVEPLEDMPEARYRAGAAAITYPDLRWARRDIKSLNLLPNVLARQAAAEAGADEAILIERDGLVTEASAHSVFVVHAGVLITREEGPHILSSITRALVLDCARRIGVPVYEGPYTETLLRRADEVFLAGTSPGVWGVTRLDGEAVGSGAPGPVTLQLREAYMARVAAGEDRLEASG